MGLTPSFRRPNYIPQGAAHASVVSAIQSHDNSITDLNQAIATQSSQIAALKSSSTSSGTSSTTQVSTENITNNISGGPVNNQIGNVVYTTTQMDNGALILLGDSSPVAVTLNQSLTLPWYCFVLNSDTGLVTLTPQLGTINGAANETLTKGLFSVVFFDGSNFWAASVPIVPENTPPVLHQWLKSYDATTGLFTQTQPAFTDISGIATTAQIGTGTPSAGEYVDGGTGAWTALPSSVFNFSDEEIPSGVIDGTNVTYTLAHSPSPAGSLILTLAGLVQWQDAGGDYTLSGATITFSSAPTLGPLIAWYRY